MMCSLSYTVVLLSLTSLVNARFSTDNDDQAKWQYSESVPVNISFSLKSSANGIEDRLNDLLRIVNGYTTGSSQLLKFDQFPPEEFQVEETRIDTKKKGDDLDITVYIAHKSRNATRGEKAKTARLHCILTPLASSCTITYHIESTHTLPFLIVCVVILFAFLVGLAKETCLRRSSANHELLTNDGSEESGSYTNKREDLEDNSNRNARDLLSTD